MMDFDELKQILDMVHEHQLTEFELEREGFKIRIRKDGFVQTAAAAPAPHAAGVAARGATTMAGDTPGAAAAPIEDRAEGEIELAVVKSPIVGTFYRSPEPGAAPFVQVGDRVRKQQVLCIIEAMKLMNEITSDYEGEIVNVYVENSQPVQYGERLFAIRTT